MADLTAQLSAMRSRVVARDVSIGKALEARLDAERPPQHAGPTRVVGLLSEPRLHAAVRFVISRVVLDADVDVLWLHAHDTRPFVRHVLSQLRRRVASRVKPAGSCGRTRGGAGPRAAPHTGRSLAHPP